MSNIDFDTMLYRTIANGKEFEKLIPKSKCVKIKSGVGETDFSMKEIKAMSEEYSWQMQKVAQLLTASSFKGSLENIKDFIYNHFQYKADKDDQMMRSPACSWHDRYTGIDCKSYSILASCILSEMQIVHHIRRIKQPSFAPNDFTHVYVIVPIDQATGDLKKGYYTIDGTLKENIEPLYVQKDDILMSLQHYRLNAPQQQGLGFSIEGYDPRNINDIKSFLSSLDCIGGSAWNKNEIGPAIDRMKAFYDPIIFDINQAVVNNDPIAFSNAITNYIGFSTVALISAKKKLNEGWNSCSTKVLKAIVKAYEFYAITVVKSLEAWLNEYFIVDMSKSLTTKPFNSNVLMKDVLGNDKYFYALLKNTLYSAPNRFYNPKSVDIKTFQVTPYVIDSANSQSFNPLQFISSLGNILTSFAPNSPYNPSNPGNQNGGNGTNYNNDGIAPPQIEQSGFGIAGWLIVGVGVTALMTGGFKNATTKKTK